MNGSFETLSSNLKLKSPLNPAYKTTDIVELSWTTNLSPDYLQLEVSSDDGATWTIAQSNIQNTGVYSWDLNSLLPQNYLVGISVINKGTAERYVIGEILIDNQVPVAGADQVISVTEDSIKTFDINLPVENDLYTLELQTQPTKGSLTVCTTGAAMLHCKYTPNPDNDLDDSFTYKIKDRAGYESAIATVTLDLQPVNDIPVVTTLSCAATVGENINYSCPITATDVDLPSPLTLTYSLDPATTCGPWLSVDANTGIVSGTPTAAEVGTTCDISVFSTDDTAAESLRFAWAIAITNSPPIINIAGTPIAILEDAALATILSAAQVSSIEEGGGSVYSLQTPTIAGDKCEDHVFAPSATHLTIDSSTGAVQFKPAADYQGTCNIRIALTDTFPSTGFTDVAIAVTNRQDAPVISTSLSPCVGSATEDSLYTCTVIIADPDPENLSTVRDASDTCSWLTQTVSSDGRTVTLSGTPVDSDVGSCTLALQTTDPQSATDTESLSITAANAEPSLTIGTPSVLTEDDPSFSSPVIVLTNSQVASLDEGLGSYSLDFTGLTGVACNDSSVVVTAATDFTINATNGETSFKPRADYFGTCYAVIKFDDGNGAPNSVVSQEVAFIVNPINDAPAITTIPTSHEILLSPSGSSTSSFDLDVDIGPANENAQNLEIICTNSNTSRLSVDCSGARVGDGLVTVQLSATAGLDTTSIVTVKVRDSGDGTNESTIATVNVSMTDSVVLAPIASNTANYNIYAQANSQFGAVVAASTRTFVVTVNSGVIVTSADPTLPAMRTGALATGARIRLINKGQIIGGSGAGGSSPSGATGAERMGQHGGTAFKIDAIYNNITIQNEGDIFGGGGGGGRGGTDNTDAGGGGQGGQGEASAVIGSAGASSGGAGGNIATNLGGGNFILGDYSPVNGVSPIAGGPGQGGSSCFIGTALGNSAGEAYFGRGGFGAGFGGGAGACSTSYGGGGGGGYYGGGGGSGGLADNLDGGNVNTDTNGYNGGNGGAAIEVPTSVNLASDININIVAGAGSTVAGCVWNDISGYYLTAIASDSDVNNRALTFTAIGGSTVAAPPGIKFWNNGRGKAYR